MINHTPYPWNDYDKKVLGRAKTRCGQIYKDAPCVKSFAKTGKQDYSVICREDIKI